MSVEDQPEETTLRPRSTPWTILLAVVGFFGFTLLPLVGLAIADTLLVDTGVNHPFQILFITLLLVVNEVNTLTEAVVLTVALGGPPTLFHYTMLAVRRRFR